MALRFDGRNARAERWIANKSSSLITGIVQDQRAIVQRALLDGLAAGQNPRTTALDIVGRTNRKTGIREGGIIGMAWNQVVYANTAEQELNSGDPAQLRNYLRRSLRDKRYDGTIIKAINGDKEIGRADAAKIVQRYRQKLLKHRGDTIARTETITALHEAQHEAMQQVIDKGALKPNQIKKVWDATGDGRVRNSHRNLDGESEKFNGVFTTPSGARLRFPSDTSLGAGPEEVINCRCVLNIRIDFLSNVR